MVEKHIKSLLYNHDCVIIPDFGGLITRYVSARIHPVKHTLVPPSKMIAFNEKLVLNDGLLISTIAHANSISKEEAQRMVVEFVHQAKTQLNTENRFELTDIGIFKYNAERRLVFEYVEGDNLLEASFGLPELVARPIRPEEPAVLRTLLKEREVTPVVAKLPLRKRLKRVYNVAAGLALGSLVGSALYFLSLQTDYNISSLNPISLLSSISQAEGVRFTSKYAPDFVPFTEEERALAYEDIVPNFTTVAEGTPDLTEENIEEETASFDSPLLVSDESNAVEEVKEAPVKEEAKDNVVAKPVAEVKAPVTVVEGKTGRFYIITGGYARMQNAEISRSEIAAKGHEAKVLVPGRGSKLFRVSVADFATAEEAQLAMKDYRKSFGETIWVHNN